MFASGIVLFGAMGALPLYFQLARADSAQHAGLLLIPLGAGMGLALLIAGKLADKIAPRTIAHAHTAAGLAEAFGTTFWWVLAFTGVMLIPILFLPGTTEPRR